MFRGWKARPERVTRTVYGPHPYSIGALMLDAMYGRSLAGADPAVRVRQNPGSAYAGRFMGDGGAKVQPFTPANLFGQSNARLHVRPSSLPATTLDMNPAALALFRAGI